MYRSAETLLGVFAVLSFACAVAGETVEAGHFGYGETATAEQVAGWDIDVRPDGMGLPPGGASAEDGEMLYEDQCASCHGSFGEGVGRYPVLAGGEGTLTEARPEKTVGSFWPYASTLWDYIHRAMPFTQPETLTDEEVYAITAYVLYLNDLIEYDYELTQINLADIEMPNRNGFFLDDRPDVRAKRCMRNCKAPGSIEITSEPAIAEDDGDSEEVEALVDENTTGQAVYQQACAVCHETGVGEAPIPGDYAAWSARLITGRDALVNSALVGKGIMPAKGGQLQLSDAEAVSAVDYIIRKSTKQ
jgi:cytochrome c5